MIKQTGDNITIEVDNIRTLSKLNPWRSLLVLFVEWSIIASTIAISEHFGLSVIYFIAWLIIGSRMYALYSLLHDGMHFLLFPQKQINDWLCRLCLAWPMFISLKRIRAVHFAHHQFLKTPDDPEEVHLEYSEFQFPKPAPDLAMTFLKDITGINFIYYKSRKLIASATHLGIKAKTGGEIPRGDSPQFEMGMIIYYMIVGLILVFTRNEVRFILYWIIPYITVYQLLNRLRLSTEHFHLPVDRLLQTRTVKLNLISRIIFSPYNLGFHAEHHLYPSVPFYRLPDLHKKLMEISTYRNNVVLSKSYWDVIKEYVK